MLRLEGKAYTTRKGKDVPAVPPIEFVTCKCKSKCTDSLPTEIRKIVYEQFCGISSIDQRRQFVVDIVLSGPKKQITVQENSRRSQTWDYFLDKNTENGTERIQVCRNVFYKTSQMKEKFVR